MLGGRYEIRRALGAGGMGAVYEAMHLRLGRPSAIKVLLPDLASSPEFQVRFEREARAAAALKSPHVVRVYDVDTTPDGLTFIVMELLEGNDLGQEVDLRDVPYPELVDWIVQACAGLAEAHARGIIHRDLKPANIFLARGPDGARVAKLLDFGISKNAQERTAITRPMDGVLGTPSFMAPEQIRGRPADARADIWAMGVIAYWLLSRTWPFHGSSDQAYLAAALVDPPVPLSARRPDLPPRLCDVVMRALAKSPDDRWPTAAALGAALSPFGAGHGPVAGRVSRSESDPDLWRSVPPAAPSARARVVVDADAQDATRTIIGTGPTHATAASGRSAPPRRLVTLVSVALIGGAMASLVVLAAYIALAPPSAAARGEPSARPPTARPSASAAPAPETTGPEPAAPPTATVEPAAPPTATVAPEPSASPATTASASPKPRDPRAAPRRAPPAGATGTAPTAPPTPSADLPQFL